MDLGFGITLTPYGRVLKEVADCAFLTNYDGVDVRHAGTHARLHGSSHPRCASRLFGCLQAGSPVAAPPASTASAAVQLHGLCIGLRPAQRVWPGERPGEPVLHVRPSAQPHPATLCRPSSGYAQALTCTLLRRSWPCLNNSHWCCERNLQCTELTQQSHAPLSRLKAESKDLT